ncbi:hypothetical protein D0Z07_1014 [Hyphodiscus hymeniophilus]|uniref:Methyltransferase domain-containing protein n=1 Tax=Hyphodiscus hymeniophilus TaxID=353542 RepID=A0A9P6VPX6_9HELO|nr:hypothetical protein D0Z07_1014 [Hyphodiscus hymeniophilus]
MAAFTPKQCLPPSPALMAELMGYCSLQIAHQTVALAEPKPGAIVLDNACGNGAVTLSIINAKKPSEVTIHATDLNARMCEVTASQAASKGWADPVTTAAMPAAALTFDDSSFLPQLF